MPLTHDQMYEWWDNAAKSNAMTAILSNEAQWNEPAFFKTGQEWLAQFADFAAAAGLQLGGETALDFGCGIGRMAHALTRSYARVVGVDISHEMIRQEQESAGSAPVEFITAAQ